MGSFPPSSIDIPPPSRGIASLTVQTPSSSPSFFPENTAPPNSASTAPSPKHHTKPSRWSSAEFIVYELAVAVGLALLVSVGVGLGSASHPNYGQYSYRLRKGWIFGRLMDMSDHQYSTFHSNLPALLGLSSSFLLLRYISVFLSADRSTFLTLFALGSLTVMHGLGVLKILLIVLVNYALSLSVAGTRWAVWVAWLFVGLVLVGNEWSEGWSRLSLNGYMGLIPRWHISFNITALRLLSFNLDHHWALQTLREIGPTDRAGSLEADQTDQSSYPTERERASSSRELTVYRSVGAYLAYVLYTPLYIAGPIITFNNFQYQTRRPPVIPRRTIWSYALRFVIAFLSMELILHWIYVVALKDSKAWRGLGPGELVTLGFWNLIIVWLKLLIPWRFFRLWALLDGIDPPENMVRCMANNYSCAGFWRSWHRSYNLWIVRYIYVPLGGKNRPVRATLIVFTFVALWHDLSFTLLTWGWLVSLVVIPELVAGRVLPSSLYGETRWYRHLKALGGVLNILTMTSANLLGFVLGPSGIQELLFGIRQSSSGLGAGLAGLAGVFAAVQLMMEYRQEERRRGIWRKY